MTGKLCKARLPLLKNQFGDRSDLFSDGEALLHEIATAHPKYNQMIRTLPILLNFIPEELKRKTDDRRKRGVVEDGSLFGQ
jgi:hypothetical protein